MEPGGWWCLVLYPGMRGYSRALLCRCPGAVTLPPGSGKGGQELAVSTLGAGEGVAKKEALR